MPSRSRAVVAIALILSYPHDIFGAIAVGDLLRHWLPGRAYTLYSPIIAGPILAFFGYILQGELQANYGITFPWWVFSLIAIPVVAVLGFYGIKLSVRTIVILGGLEFLIVLALGLSGLISPGPGGFTVRVFDPGFNPGHLATATGFALAIASG